MKIELPMVSFSNLIMVNIWIWDKTEEKYVNMLITCDTGASITTISADLLHKIGYDTTTGITKRITTASSVEYVKSIQLEKMMIGDIEIFDIEVYAHSFPPESFSFGVLGLNVFTLFDVSFLFSKKIIGFSKI